MSDRPLATSYTSSHQASAVIGTSQHHGGTTGASGALSGFATDTFMRSSGHFSPTKTSGVGATAVPTTTYSTAGYTSTIPTTTYTTTTYNVGGTSTSGTYGGTYGTTTADEAYKRSGTGVSGAGAYTTTSQAHGGLASSGYTSATHGHGYVPQGSYTSYAQGGIPASLTTSVTGYNVTPSYSHSASHDIHHGVTGQSGYRTGGTGTFEIHAVQPSTSIRTSEVAKRTTRQSDIRQSNILAPYRSTMYPEFELVEDLPDRRNLVDSINFLLIRSNGRESLLTSPTKVNIKRQSALQPAEIEFESLLREKLEDGSVFEGQARHGHRHGKGKITYKDGRVFEGQFENGRATGTGLLRYKTGKVCYEGGFHDTAFEGQGVLQSETPIPFKGGFNYRNLNQVENHWIKYEGEFRNGKRHGRGTLFLTNGEKFVGEWRDDQISGRGQFHLLDGHAIEGTWDNGVWRD